jgi:hypothetical protein
MKINIAGVHAPTEKQRNVGIHGSVNLELSSPDGTVIARLNGITVRESKAGNKFMSPPAFKIVGKDGSDKWLQHYNLFPLGNDESNNIVQKDSLNKLTQEVLRMLDGAGSKNSQSSAQSTPVTQGSVNPANETEPWN